MVIQKQLTSDVFFLEGGLVEFTLKEKCTMNILERFAGIRVTDINGKNYDILLRRVAQTQILPAAAVDFSGDVANLWALLTTSFFEELHANSGGGKVEDNITSVGVNYNILTTDYIICATANITVRLPTIGTDIGQVYRIFANGFNVQISCNDPFGDRIMGETTQNISGFDMVSARAIYTNQWLIAD